MAIINARTKPLVFPALLILLTSLISLLNYTPGTFLTGWDTLHPEFNFPNQLGNIIFGAFRSDQGLGAVAAHAHMIELPRVLILWLFSFVLPLDFLRYSVVFLSFILGPLGIYFFTKHILKGQSAVAFLASLVYIFNLGTVQHFYLPFEMFMAQYAALGWLFLVASKYTELPKLSTLFLFALLTFIASPMAYAPVLWYAYFASLLLFLFILFVAKRNRKVFFASLFLVFVTVLVNLYWILPNLYFLTNTASGVSAAQTNRIFSDEAFLHNKEYGNILDVAILRNFLFNWAEQITPDQGGDLMGAWKEHLSNKFTLAIGYGVFIIAAIGIGIAVFRRNVLGIALIPIYFMSLIMLMNMNPPFEPLFSYLRDNFTLFKEGLRFPFTKFSILLMFAMSVFFAFSLSEIINALGQIRKQAIQKSLTLFVLVGITASLVWYGYPMFQGRLIDPQMRIAIPKSYFDLFTYLKKQPNHKRVAPLPLNSIWGWEYYNWGYQGAGFTWFGINQPVLTRDFDRWNPDNEQYFKEMSSAFYSRDVTQVEALAKKYRISYFILDESVYSPGNKPNSLWHYETHDMFEKSDKIDLVDQFGSVYLFEVNKSLVGDGYIQKSENIVSVGPKIKGGFVDLAARSFGDYVVSDDPDIVYPSRSLVNRYDRIDPKNVTYDGSNLIIKLDNNRGNVLSTNWLNDDILPSFMRESYDTTLEEKGLPYTVGDETYFSLPVTAGIVNVTDSLQISEDCGRTVGQSVSELTKQDGFATFKARDSSSCGYILFPTQKQDFGSLLMLEAKNEKGLPVRLCLSDRLTSRCGLYTSLDSGDIWKQYAFMIPPQPSGAYGYAVHFNVVGIGASESVNKIRNVRFIQIPYYRIANLSFVKEGFMPSSNKVEILNSWEVNPTLYKIEAKGTGLISFFKAFDNGWKAYKVKGDGILNTYLPFLNGTELKDHVRINNWANGWKIEEELSGDERIIIVFLPQYLQFLGFFTLCGTLLCLLLILAVKKLKKSNSN